MHFPRNWPSFFAMFHDTLMAGLSLWLAHYLRLGGMLIPFSGQVLELTTLPFMLLAMLGFVAAGLYRGLWRYASMQDLLTLAKAVTLVLLVFYLGLFLFLRLEGVPRSVPVIHWLVLVAMLGGPRFLYRSLKDRRLGLSFTLATPHKVPVLLIGANDAAELFIRESRRNPQAPYHVVGLVEDDHSRRGQQVHGVRIYGGSDSLAKIIGKLERKGRKPQRVVLAESDPDGDTIREILDICEAAGLPLSRIPQTLELQSGNPSEKLEIRPIAVEDLLRRAQQVHDRSGMEALVRGKTVLVTGAGGTIGSELVRQIAGFAPKALVLYEHAEYQLYLIERELADAGMDFPVAPLLGDVRDPARLEQVFAAHQPELVFHAAALKHVPLAEANPVETVATNALGTACVAAAAAKHKAQAMVLISTDKAVHPSSVMGATKRLAEQVMQGYASVKKYQTTRFVAVRFGNVLGSTGSVVPRFQAQLAAGGPLTVTHPEMTRYFMTVREAVELVIQAAAIGIQSAVNGALNEEARQAGRVSPERERSEQPMRGSADPQRGIYVLDMGQPVKIDELARQMIRLAGLSTKTIRIEYTGLRPGEKLHEELAYADEALTPTAHHAIRIAHPKHVSLTLLQKRLAEMDALCRKQEHAAVVALLGELVPEYTPEASA